MNSRNRHLVTVFLWASMTTASAIPPLDDRFEIRFRIDRSQSVEEVYRYLQRRVRAVCRNPAIWHPEQRKGQAECESGALEQVISVLDWGALNRFHARASSKERRQRTITQTQ